jgi:putative ABC transport system ATP-binding protein
MRATTKDQGRSIFLVTHNSEITKMADRVVHLRSGRISEVETNPSPLPAQELRW